MGEVGWRCASQDAALCGLERVAWCPVGRREAPCILCCFALAFVPSFGGITGGGADHCDASASCIRVAARQCGKIGTIAACRVARVVVADAILALRPGVSPLNRRPLCLRRRRVWVRHAGVAQPDSLAASRRAKVRVHALSTHEGSRHVPGYPRRARGQHDILVWDCDPMG